MILSVARARIVLFLIAAYVILNHGFALVRFPPGSAAGVPTAELMVLLFMMTFVFDLRRLPSFAMVAPFAPLLLWWGLGAVQALRGLEEYGIWALRDASHLIDSLFLWIGFVVAASPEFFTRFSRWLRIVLNIGALYGLLFPFRELLAAYSPKITAPAGYTVAVFFNYISGSLIPLTAAMAWLVDRVRYLALPAVVLAGALIVYIIVIFQARITYLQVITLFFMLAILRPRDAARMSVGLLIGVSLLALLMASGIEISGRLGEKFSLDFLFEHFASIWGEPGQGMAASAADGVGLRIRWWTRIWNDTTSEIGSLLFGLGYGIPLTDFYTPENAIVREPHNSFISQFARLGLTGLLAFLWVQLQLIRSWFRVYRNYERLGITIWRNNLLIMGTFFLMLAILSLGEDGFEKPFNAIPYYFFWGIILRAEFEMRAASKAVSERQPEPSPHIFYGQNDPAGRAIIPAQGPAR